MPSAECGMRSAELIQERSVIAHSEVFDISEPNERTPPHDIFWADAGVAACEADNDVVRRRQALKRDRAMLVMKIGAAGFAAFVIVRRASRRMRSGS